MKTSVKYGPQIQTGHLAAESVGTSEVAADSLLAGDIAANAIGNSELNGAMVQIGLITVSSAELLALRATPKTLVAAFGANIISSFLSATLFLDYNSTAYVESSADIVARLTDDSGAIVSTTLDSTGLLDATSDQLRTLKPIATDYTPIANTPIVLHNAGAGEWTTGDSPLYVYVRYALSDLSLAGA